MIAIALVASVMLANAQKPAETLIKGINAAKEATLNPKKADKPATWIALGKKNLEAYKESFGQAIPGMNKVMVQETNGNFKPTGTTEETVSGQTFNVDIYPTCKYYYAADGNLRFIALTKEIVPGSLDEAYAAYKQAAVVDPKGSKAEDIKKAFTEIADKYNEEGINSYNFGNHKDAADKFLKCFNVKNTAPLSQVDTSTLFNAGLASQMSGDIEGAAKCYEECLAYGYSQEGMIFAKLAECKKELGDIEGAKATLQNGFISNPQNQNILIGLINLYLDTNDDPQKIVELLKMAEANEPGNASLYYVEGNMYIQFGDEQKAFEAYTKCSETDPTYPYGEIGKGVALFTKADKIREQADAEMNQKKYDALVEQYDAALLEAAKYFENGFNITKDEALKKNLADYLKSIYFRFRTDANYKDKYEQYKTIFDSLQ